MATDRIILSRLYRRALQRRTGPTTFSRQSQHRANKRDIFRPITGQSGSGLRIEVDVRATHIYLSLRLRREFSNFRPTRHRQGLEILPALVSGLGDSFEISLACTG